MTTPTDKGRSTLEDRLDAEAVQESLTVEPTQEQAAIAAASAASMDRVTSALLGTLTPAERAVLAKRMLAKTEDAVLRHAYSHLPSEPSHEEFIARWEAAHPGDNGAVVSGGVAKQGLPKL